MVVEATDTILAMVVRLSFLLLLQTLQITHLCGGIMFTSLFQSTMALPLAFQLMKRDRTTWLEQSDSSHGDEKGGDGRGARVLVYTSRM